MSLKMQNLQKQGVSSQPFIPSNTEPLQGPLPVWVDCDTGHDDAFALLVAAYHPSLNLVGASSVFGNAPLQHTSNNTYNVLKVIGKADVPTLQGEKLPLNGMYPARTAGAFHGSTGLYPIEFTEKKPNDSRDGILGAKLMEAINSHSSKTGLNIVATAPLTNLARFFDTNPGTVEKINRLVIMGGAVGNNFTKTVLGKITDEGVTVPFPNDVAEFNIWLDPEAAQKIFSNKQLAQKITLVPLDLTHQAIVDKATRKRFSGSNPQNPSSPIRKLFHEILKFNTETYTGYYPGVLDGPPLHDVVAVGALLPNVLSESEDRYNINVNCESEKPDPKGELRGRLEVSKSEDGKGVTIPKMVSNDLLWDCIEDALYRAEEATAHNPPWESFTIASKAPEE